MAPVEGREQRDDVVGRIRADAQKPAHQPARGREQLLGLGLLGEQAPGHVEQAGARVGQLDAAPAALEQAHVVGRLERRHLARERRLGDAQRGGRAGEAALAGDRVKGAKLRVIYRHSLFHT